MLGYCQTLFWHVTDPISSCFMLLTAWNNLNPQHQHRSGNALVNSETYFFRPLPSRERTVQQCQQFSPESEATFWPRKRPLHSLPRSLESGALLRTYCFGITSLHAPISVARCFKTRGKSCAARFVAIQTPGEAGNKSNVWEDKGYRYPLIRSIFAVSTRSLEVLVLMYSQLSVL